MNNRCVTRGTYVHGTIYVVIRKVIALKSRKLPFANIFKRVIINDYYYYYLVLSNGTFTSQILFSLRNHCSDLGEPDCRWNSMSAKRDSTHREKTMLTAKYQIYSKRKRERKRRRKKLKFNEDRRCTLFFPQKNLCEFWYARATGDGLSLRSRYSILFLQ